MRNGLGWMLILLWAGCSAGTSTPGTEDQPTSASVEAGAAGTVAENGSGADGDPSATPSTRAAPSPATRAEITSLCKLYRKALRSRWDDARTRQEVGSLEMTTGTALDWQQALTSGDVDTALAASREVVTAAEAANLTTECEALVSLVILSEAMRAAPQALQR